MMGRVFGDIRRAEGTSVVIINESMASRYWPDDNPLGKYIMEISEERTENKGNRIRSRAYEIIGVVDNVRHLQFNKFPGLYDNNFAFIAYQLFEFLGGAFYHGEGVVMKGDDFRDI